MPHVLIAGITEAGKTTLATRISHEYKRLGKRVIVLDPLLDPRWKADLVTNDTEEFLEEVKACRSAEIFLDESGETVGRYQTEMFWLATRARHFGHNTHFLTQRPQQLSPTVRDQCSYLFLFCVALRDAKILSDDFNQPQLLQASTLERGRYFWTSRFQQPVLFHVEGIYHANGSNNSRVAVGARLVRNGQRETGERNEEEG